MHRLMIGDSLFSRRRWLGLWLLALLLVAATLLGGERTVAQEGQTLGFIWGPACWTGPSCVFTDMRSPLNDGRVFKAISMAVDGDAISERLLGEPGLVVSVEGMSQPVAPAGGAVFFPEQSRSLLEDAGITSLTLSIAGDPDVPVTAQIAEAIAADLRANIGAQVTVVEGDADFVVRQAALSEVPPPEPSPHPPLPPLPAGTVSFDSTCTPDTFQPNVWVAVECVTHLTNNGADPLSDIVVNIAGSRGVIPEYYWMWYILDGVYTPIAPGDLTFSDVPTLQPGQTSESRLLVLLRMPEEGRYDGIDEVTVGDREGVSVPTHFVASSGADAPPKDLLVTKTMANGGMTNGTPPQVANFETKVTNQGSSTVTSLTITDRSDDGEFLASGPMPESRDDRLHLVTWNLASFGKDSLAPGESVVVHTTYGPADSSGCAPVSSVVVVEADVGGMPERYAAGPGDLWPVGNCDIGEGMPGGRGGPMGVGMGGVPATGFGRGGEGPVAGESDVVWAAMVLAGGGLALVAAARLIRKRA